MYPTVTQLIERESLESGDSLTNGMQTEETLALLLQVLHNWLINMTQAILCKYIMVFDAIQQCLK